MSIGCVPLYASMAWCTRRIWMVELSKPFCRGSPASAGSHRRRTGRPWRHCGTYVARYSASNCRSRNLRFVGRFQSGADAPGFCAMITGRPGSPACPMGLGDRFAQPCCRPRVSGDGGMIQRRAAAQFARRRSSRLGCGLRFPQPRQNPVTRSIAQPQCCLPVCPLCCQRLTDQYLKLAVMRP